MTKVGFSQDAPNRIYIANLEGYAGKQNWHVRARLYSSNAGQIELAAHRALRNYAIKQAWDRNGAISVTREVFICSYETAREALVSVVPSAEASLLEEFSPRR